MQSPRNPSRRNRNIGTAKQGHGDDNRLVIPDTPGWDLCGFEEFLKDPFEYSFEVHGERRVALVERPLGGFVYGSTVQDLERMLGLLPEREVLGLDLFLFRQPTKKQRTLSSVWGRFLYFSTPGPFSGPALCIEASDLGMLSWSKSIQPDTQRELDRLQADGHRIVQTKRAIEIHMTAASLRATTLFRTVLHEVGHYVDWTRSSRLVKGSKEEVEAAQRAFRTKPSTMKEDFAHRFAAETLDRLKQRGQAPFHVQWDSVQMEAFGLERSWFVRDEP